MVKTPQEKWNEAIIEYKKKCQKIISVSKSIRYIGIVNEYGRTLTGILKPGLKPFWNSQQTSNEFFLITTLLTLRKNQSKAVGDLDYLILRHPKVIIVAFQKKGLAYYISIEGKETQVEKIISKIKKFI